MTRRFSWRASLTRRLLVVLLGSLTIVASLLGLGGAWFSHGVAEQTADRVLKASARAIAETLAVDQGEITLDLPPAALGMLEDDARDNVYYNIRHNGGLVTGYPDFPAPDEAAVSPDRTYFRYIDYRGVRVRVATEARYLPRVEGLVIVQVAETLTERKALERRLLLAIAVLEIGFLGMAGLLVWPAVAWSLRPLTRLRDQLENRGIADLAPLDERPIPAELLGVVSGFNSLLRRLETAVGGMRRFTADASHQLRTPLTVLRTHLEVLRRRGADSPEGQASLRDIEAAAERLGRLINQLIALARAEEGAAGASVGQTFNLTEIAAETMRRLTPAGLARDVEMIFDRPAADVIARGNALFVEEILANLLENAIRYIQPGGTVTVRTGHEGDEPVLTVEDDGPGIPAKDREKVFGRFHRLPRDRAEIGSGLGLPIVRTLALAMGAKVDLSARPGGRPGLLATVRLRPAS